jgi:hypothetical protein
MALINKAGAASIASRLAVVAIGVAIAFAPAAGAEADPDTPYGPNPTTTLMPMYHVDNQDDENTSNGFVDRPF